MDSAGDPVLAFGPRNTVYYGNIVFSRAAPADGGTEAPAASSSASPTTAACTWAEPTIIQLDGVDAHGNSTPTTFFNDKIWLAADKTSGRVYVTWTRFADDRRRQLPRVADRGRRQSTDFGRTFSHFTRVDTTLAGFTGGLTPFSQGSNPQVGRDGTLYIAYEGDRVRDAGLRPARPTGTSPWSPRSHDHGRTFSHAIVDTNFDFPLNEASAR